RPDATGTTDLHRHWPGCQPVRTRPDSCDHPRRRLHHSQPKQDRRYLRPGAPVPRTMTNMRTLQNRPTSTPGIGPPLAANDNPQNSETHSGWTSIPRLPKGAPRRTPSAWACAAGWECGGGDRYAALSDEANQPSAWRTGV